MTPLRLSIYLIGVRPENVKQEDGNDGEGRTTREIWKKGSARAWRRQGVDHAKLLPAETF